MTAIARALVGWGIILSWAIITEELVRLWGPLPGAAFVFVTLLVVAVVSSRGGSASADRREPDAAQLR